MNYLSPVRWSIVNSIFISIIAFNIVLLSLISPSILVKILVYGGEIWSVAHRTDTFYRDRSYLGNISVGIWRDIAHRPPLLHLSCLHCRFVCDFRVQKLTIFFFSFLSLYVLRSQCHRPSQRNSPAGWDSATWRSVTAACALRHWSRTRFASTCWTRNSNRRPRRLPKAVAATAWAAARASVGSATRWTCCCATAGTPDTPWPRPQPKTGRRRRRPAPPRPPDPARQWLSLWPPPPPPPRTTTVCPRP